MWPAGIYFELQRMTDEEVFEIVDFTTASEWERFTASLEEIIHEWQLPGERKHQSFLKGELANATWIEKVANIKYSEKDDFEADSLPQALKDFMDRENDFPARAHCLVRWYGFYEFITVVPFNSTEYITSLSKAKLIQSALHFAVVNTDCQIPVFVQIMHPNEKMYIGTSQGYGMHTQYDMVHVKQLPQQYTHLSGLVEMFKGKLHCTVASPPILVSVRFTYILSEWPHTQWMQEPPDFDATLQEIGFSELGILPFGALSDPVSELHVSATWPCVTDDLLIDSEVHSDLDPVSAPTWAARLVMAPSPPCLLSEYLYEYTQICRNEESLSQILGFYFEIKAKESELMMALNKLTEDRVPTISSVINHAKKHRRSLKEVDRGVIPVDILNFILNYLFPDDLDDLLTKYPENLPQSFPWAANEKLPTERPLKTYINNMKSSSVVGFLWRLSVVLSHAVHSLGGIQAAAQIWYEVILELRFHWDNGVLLPGIAGGTPDMSSSLLNQKLQMLNYCISRKIAMHDACDTDVVDDDIEDEFYECDDAEVEDEQGLLPTISCWDRPEGRLKKCGQLRLLKNNEFLYIPITQESPPVTEDRLEEQADTLIKLGSDSIGSELRARMMSSSLFSDMESFKAANPGCCLEDFVRWYSPRDWIEDENDKAKGHLSSRMQIPGNLWQEVWEMSKPVPARRQKRLFDETREAEQVLAWFASTSPGTLCGYLLPTLFCAAFCRFEEEELLYTLPASQKSDLPHLAHDSSLIAVLEVIAQRVIRLSRQPADILRYQEVVDQLAVIECRIAQAQSVRHKIIGSKEEIPYLQDLVMQFLKSPEVLLEGGPKGEAATVIRKLFQEVKKSANFLEDSNSESELPSASKPCPSSELGAPAGREYLLRTMAPAPASHSRPLPQRMFAVLLSGDARIAGAFSQDTVFC